MPWKPTAPLPSRACCFFAYVAACLYEGDSRWQKRRAQALTVDRIRGLLGEDELRRLLIPPSSRASKPLQCLSHGKQAHHGDALHHLLQLLGDLAEDAEALPGARRFRPIVLTSFTTFFGLMPMILEQSRQARFLVPMAISLGFGVLFATLSSC